MAINQIHIPEMTLNQNDIALLYQKAQSVKAVDAILRALVGLGKAKSKDAA